METLFEERLTRLEREVRRIDRELADLRLEVTETQEPVPVPVPALRLPVQEPEHEPAPAPAPAPQPIWPPVVQPSERRVRASRTPKRRPELDLTLLLGAKSLAWVGGAVTLLGVVFFYVLAVNRGWIGPEVRIALGGIASSTALGAGFWLRRRFGASSASLGAAGAGIAGYCTTLLAAAQLYDLLPDTAALGLAALVAAAGVAVSLAWSEQLLAGLGLVGALVVPALLATEGGLTRIGTAFAVIVFCGAATVGRLRRWTGLLVVGTLGAALEVAALVLTRDRADGLTVALTGLFCLALLAVAIALQLLEGEELDELGVTYALGSAGLAFASAAFLYRHEARDLHAEGLALLVAAAVYAVPALVLRRAARDLASVIGALALALGAVAVADLLSGATLTYAWAAEAIVLSWLGYRLAAPRFQPVALVYLGLALGHALLAEARPADLFVASRHPASGIPSLVAVAAAALAVALLRPSFGSLRGTIDRALAPLESVQGTIATGALTLVAAVGLDVLGLLVLEAYPESSFHRAHVLVTGVWSLAGVVAVVLAARRSRVVVTQAFSWLGLVFVKVVGYDWTQLAHHTVGWSLLLCGGGLLAAGYLLRVVDESDEPLGAVAAITSPVALLMGIVAAGRLLGFELDTESNRGFGAGLLALATVYGGLAAAAFRSPRLRTLSRIHWGLALPLLWAGEALVIANAGWVGVAWAATAAVLAALSYGTSERGFQLASALVLATALLVALAKFAPPDRFWDATAHPASGIWVLLACIAAATALVAFETQFRRLAVVATAALAVYAVSLAILEIAEDIFGSSVGTDFQRGHTVVSAFWGLLGLGLLYAGLRRSSTGFRAAGFALFGVSLVKIFLYDLARLSSITRALSFLGVGAVLLAAAFFYQRLAAENNNGAHA
jgi:uncharacterized membrane protein